MPSLIMKIVAAVLTRATLTACEGHLQTLYLQTEVISESRIHQAERRCSFPALKTYRASSRTSQKNLA